jgi:hypothetical protein
MDELQSAQLTWRQQMLAGKLDSLKRAADRVEMNERLKVGGRACQAVKYRDFYVYTQWCTCAQARRACVELSSAEMRTCTLEHMCRPGVWKAEKVRLRSVKLYSCSDAKSVWSCEGVKCQVSEDTLGSRLQVQKGAWDSWNAGGGKQEHTSPVHQ